MFSHYINNSNNLTINNNFYAVPFGQRCTSALACKYANIRNFSLPFDWTIPLFPSKIKKVLEYDFYGFIPDVHNNHFDNIYDIGLAHFNPDIEKGVNEYKRRIDRFNYIMNDNKKKYFVYINEDYLYDDNYRNDHFNDTIFNEMLDLEYFLHLFSFKTPILLGKKIRKNVKSTVGISPTMVLLFLLLFLFLKK